MILSLMKWQSISICLVLSWNIGVTANCIAELLSQKTKVGWSDCTPKSLSNCLNQIISLVTDPIALYSASVELLETVVCFFDFQEIKESPRKTQNHVTDLRVSIHPAQSESLKALSCKDYFDERNNPWPGFPFKNRNKCWAACQCGTFGAEMNWLNRCTT